jgi:N-acetylglucosaminyl-diphospho-decaprenol L-rhamnosyltransferase
MATLSTIIITHNSRAAVGKTLPALIGQLRSGDELIVVDNASSDGTPDVVKELAPDAAVVETGGNLGFGAACNRGAQAASGELLCFLNPDAAPDEGFRDAIERPLADGRGWAAWQGLVTAYGGRQINTRGGVVHYTGIAWAGGAGQPLDGDRAKPLPEPGFVSGACLGIDRSTFLDHGGFAEDFFLYHEDVDLSLRLRLAGAKLGVEPEARVDHEYEFAKGPAKWRYLERNRWATVIRTYPAALLALLVPGLLATELALIAIAARGGWLPEKLAAWGDTLRSLPRLLRERRAVQARRVVGAGDFAHALTADLDSPYLGAAGRSGLVRILLRGYWSAVVALLGSPRPLDPRPLDRSSGTPFDPRARSS